MNISKMHSASAPGVQNLQFGNFTYTAKSKPVNRVEMDRIETAIARAFEADGAKVDSVLDRKRGEVTFFTRSLSQDKTAQRAVEQFHLQQRKTYSQHHQTESDLTKVGMGVLLGVGVDMLVRFLRRK